MTIMTNFEYFRPYEPYKIELPVEADSRDEAEERAGEIEASVLAIVEPALKRGRCDFKVVRPRKGAFKVELNGEDFSAELMGTLTEGVSRWGGQFNYVVESNGHFPEVTGAISNVAIIRKWAIGLSMGFFVVLILLLMLIVYLFTGYIIIFGRWWLMVLPLLVGGGIGNLVGRLIVQKKFSNAVGEPSQALDRWWDVLKKVHASLIESAPD